MNDDMNDPMATPAAPAEGGEPAMDPKPEEEALMA